MNNYLISIVGPTAIGKTDLSIKLAQHFKTEIISADSRQFYKELKIGTAAPTLHDLSQVKHHFIHHKSIEDNYNVGAFEKDALQCLNILFKSHKVVVMVGGSGLYIDVISKGLNDFPEIDDDIRKRLNQQHKMDGLQNLQEQLKIHDSITYNTIELDNPHRVIRALEICIGTGRPYSSFINKNKTKRSFKLVTIGLKADRNIIYNRINDRVDHMMESGLLEEAESLIQWEDLNSLNTVGYKELFHYFKGEWDLDFAISEIKKNSRRFAKRQTTWFKKDESIIWFDIESEIETIIKVIEENIND